LKTDRLVKTSFEPADWLVHNDNRCAFVHSNDEAKPVAVTDDIACTESERMVKGFPDEAHKLGLRRVVQMLSGAFHKKLLSSGFRVCRKIGLIFLAGVLNAAGDKLPARVLPDVAFPVPMETKLRKCGGNLPGLPVVKLNPNPLANHFGQFPKARGLVVEHVQNLRCRECPVVKPLPKINPMQLF